MPAEFTKAKIKNRTELTGFLELITARQDKTVIEEKSKKNKFIKLLKLFYLYFASSDKFFLIADSHLSPLSSSFSLL